MLAAVSEVAVLVTHVCGRATAANRAAEKLLGYRRDELLGLTTTRLCADSTT